jgi:hypothetical protein
MGMGTLPHCGMLARTCPRAFAGHWAGREPVRNVACFQAKQSYNGWTKALPTSGTDAVATALSVMSSEPSKITCGEDGAGGSASAAVNGGAAGDSAGGGTSDGEGTCATGDATDGCDAQMAAFDIAGFARSSAINPRHRHDVDLGDGQ